MDNQSSNRQTSPLQPPAPPRPVVGGTSGNISNPTTPLASNQIRNPSQSFVPSSQGQTNTPALSSPMQQGYKIPMNQPVSAPSDTLKTYNATPASKTPIAPPPTPEELAKEIAQLSRTIPTNISSTPTSRVPPSYSTSNSQYATATPPVINPKLAVPPMPPVVPATGGERGNQPPSYVAKEVKPASAPSSSGRSWKMPIILFSIVVILGGAIFALYKFIGFDFLKGKQEVASAPVTLTYWGLWEPKSVMDPIIKEYQKANPNVTINYTESSPTEYAQRLRSALKSENPPDIFRIHNTWVYMFQESLSRLPTSMYTLDEYQQTFYPVATSNLRVGDNMVAIPLMFDGLSLYYNVDLFTKAGIQPPTDWNSFVEAAQAIRAPASGPIETAGAAIGTAGNIDHWPDIISVLMFQNQADPGNPTNQLAYDALTFYSLFAYRYNTWEPSWPPASEQFALGKVGMYFGPSWDVHNIKKIAKENNYQLNFKLIPIPQLPGSNVTWGSFWAESVSAKSAHQEEAWKFLKYLSQKDTMLKLYDLESKYSPDREFGEIPSRRDLADQFKDHPYIGPYIVQAEAARSYPLASSTLDKDGINDQIIRYYTDAVNNAATGMSPDAALAAPAKGVHDVLKTYGLAQ